MRKSDFTPPTVETLHATSLHSPLIKGKLTMTAVTQDYQITWEKLPDDYILPDDPVDNI